MAAIATPLGEGGLGVVRLSGPDAFLIADTIFRSSNKISETPGHTVVYGRLSADGDVLDEALASVFRAPRSYTGEDVVEFSCHGGVFLLRRVLALCVEAGARPAGPGEFTKRAFMNGRMDLVQAEAVADLISARSESARKHSVSRLQGRLSRAVETLRSETLNLLAHIEAHLDFADEEVPEPDPAATARSIEQLLSAVKALLAGASMGKALREGIRVPLIGRPNVGKSSLFNALLGEDRAIVASIPGTTRDVLEESCVADGIPLLLYDTAGLRDGADEIESEGMRRAEKAMEDADVALWVLDMSQQPSEEDAALARRMNGRKTVVAFNKADLVQNDHRAARKNLFAGLLPAQAACVDVSSRTGEGLSRLKSELAATTGRSHENEPSETLLVANARQETALQEAASALESARNACSTRGGEIVALSLRTAAGALSRVTGQGAGDDILDRVFSRFCIGK